MSELPINEIVCGDCLEVMRDFPDGCVDAVVTDPPYGLMAAPGKVQMRGHVVEQDYGSWDSAVSFDFLALLPAAPVLVVWHDQKQSTALVSAAEACGWRLKRFLFWDKGDSGLNPRRNFVNCVEVAGFFVQGKYIWNGGASSRNIIRVNRCPAPFHPTQKPLDVHVWLCELLTNPGDIVLDPFCGSGTTAVACVKTGRRFIGIELDEGYCKIARERVEAARKGLTIQEIRTGQEVLFGGNDE